MLQVAPSTYYAAKGRPPAGELVIEPVLVGMCQMSLIGADQVGPGETCGVAFGFWPGARRYVEDLEPATKPRSGMRSRVGSVRSVKCVY